MNYIHVFLKFSASNIFINIFIKYKQKYFIPLLFKTYGHESFMHSKGSNVELREFCVILAKYLNKLSNKYIPIIIIFKNFQGRFKKVNQSRRGLNHKRKFILKILLRYKVTNIINLIDESTIPYNGCKSNKHIRKKLKRVRQFKK